MPDLRQPYQPCVSVQIAVSGLDNRAISQVPRGCGSSVRRPGGAALYASFTNQLAPKFYNTMHEIMRRSAGVMKQSVARLLRRSGEEAGGSETLRRLERLRLRQERHTQAGYLSQSECTSKGAPEHRNTATRGVDVTARSRFETSHLGGGARKVYGEAVSLVSNVMSGQSALASPCDSVARPSKSLSWSWRDHGKIDCGETLGV